ncbi:hypothetical protein [Ancylobacter sp. SL191]|uniref:hypothetical protein n=1 Tax=Ancylobacter sp. SL191 TaxID=2995166 RepID=UPI0022709B2D|nr:hypothetical protein [Ancylobacter sp. SL191]WAC27998.1 hypothetical protein OU996_02720 [Ancylobacter sp. SL191]
MFLSWRGSLALCALGRRHLVNKLEAEACAGRQGRMAAPSSIIWNAGEYHRDHLRALAQRVEVVGKSEIRPMGNNSDLLRMLAAASSVGAAANGVRSFVPKWRARKDSNL